jgi:MerR family transcriptional regulator, thiopeptide resistance regulator
MWKIGELARRTGLTVRTLHHYDEIGLLSPVERSGGGHRVYGEADVQRLYRIVSLRSLGFPLEAIAAALDADGFDARAAV